MPVSCTAGLRPRALSISAAQSSHEGVGNIPHMVTMWGGGGLSGTVGKCDLLALRVTSLVVGVGALWGSSRGPWGSTMVLGAFVSLCTLPSSLYPGCWGLCAWFPVLMSSRSWGSSSLPFGLPSMSLGSNPLSSRVEMHSSCPSSHGHVLASSSHTISSPLTSSFVLPNTVCTSSSSFLPSPLTFPFVSSQVIMFVPIVMSLMVATAISGFVSLVLRSKPSFSLSHNRVLVSHACLLSDSLLS